MSHRPNSWLYDRRFPSRTSLNHTLVRIDAGDLDGPLYLDPSCLGCEVGVLPGWSADQPGLLVPRSEDGDASHIELTQRSVARFEMGMDVDAQLDAEGNMSGRATVTFGKAAWGPTGIDRDAEDLGEWHQDLARTICGNAELEGEPRARCEEGACRHEMDFLCPDYAWEQTERLEIRTGAGVGNYLTDLERREPVIVSGGVRISWAFRLVVPDGLRVAWIPPARTFEDDAVRFELESALEARLIEVTLTLEQRRGNWSPEQYDAIRRAYDAWNRARAERVALLRAGEGVVMRLEVTP